jgi:hypothetical protein
MPGIAVAGSGGLANSAAPFARSLDGSTRLNSLTPCRSRRIAATRAIDPTAGISAARRARAGALQRTGRFPGLDEFIVPARTSA